MENTMKEQEFLEEEIPFGTLARFGLTRDMIDDLPVGELRRIYGGEATSVLPIRVADESGNIIKSRTRFMLVRRADGDADVMFFPAMTRADIERFSPESRKMLLDGQPIVAEMPISDDGTETTSFVQIDRCTSQVMAVPTSVVGRNLTMLADEFDLNSSELKLLQSGVPMSVIIDEELVTVGVDLHRHNAVRISEGDVESWKNDKHRQWEKFNFGVNGCWVSNDDGGLDYVPESAYTEEMWAEMRRRNNEQQHCASRKQ